MPRVPSRPVSKDLSHAVAQPCVADPLTDTDLEMPNANSRITKPR